MTVLEWLGYLLALALALPFVGAGCALVVIEWYVVQGWIRGGAEEATADLTVPEESTDGERAE